jgi:hypothetical protein
MRVNVYAEEMTDRVELVKKEIDGREYVAVRFYLELPVTVPAEEHVACNDEEGRITAKVPQRNVKGPFVHRPGDDDSSAVTFWGKQDLRPVLLKALQLLDDHYRSRP